MYLESINLSMQWKKRNKFDKIVMGRDPNIYVRNREKGETI